MNKRGLGRGLDALLGSASSATESLTEIPVDQIDANPRQPRKAFDPTSLDELARSLKSAGMIQPVVVRRMPRPIQEDLRAGRLTMGHARALLSLTDRAEQLKLRDEILAHSWSVRATEEGVEKRRARPSPARRRSVELAALEEAMQRTLMTRVKIRGSERRGRIEITYATADELERLVATFGDRV